MAVDRQARDGEWQVADEAGKIETWERAGIAVLMDIRRELRKLNGLLSCKNFISIPQTLRKIQRNTTKPKRRKAAKTK